MELMNISMDWSKINLSLRSLDKPPEVPRYSVTDAHLDRNSILFLFSDGIGLIIIPYQNWFSVLNLFELWQITELIGSRLFQKMALYYWALNIL